MLEHVKRLIIGALTLVAVFSPFAAVIAIWGFEAVGWIVCGITAIFVCYSIGAVIRGDRP